MNIYINAIRILNNCYKHKEGVYKISSSGNSEKTLELIESWGIKENQTIDFTKLPVLEMVEMCGVFFEELRRVSSE